MHAQKNGSKDLSEINALRELNSKLVVIITELRKENAEIPELRREVAEFKKKYTEIEAECINLRQIIRDSSRREAEHAKLKKDTTNLKAENAELKARVSKLEQKQSQNDEEKSNNITKLYDDTREIDQSSNTTSNELQTEDAPVSDITDITSNSNAQITDHQLSGEVIPEVSIPSTSISKNTALRKSEISTGAPSQNSHRKKGAENIVQLIADGIRDDVQSGVKTTPCDEISTRAPCQNSSTVPLLSLAQLFDKATDAEYGAIRANQEEILRWYYYGKEFLIQVSVTIQDGKISEKKAKGIIYDKILEHLSILRKNRSEETGLRLPEISRKYLQGKTQKAVKIYKLFEKVGVNNIKYITTYTANTISELTNDVIIFIPCKGFEIFSVLYKKNKICYMVQKCLYRYTKKFIIPALEVCDECNHHSHLYCKTCKKVAEGIYRRCECDNFLREVISKSFTIW